jgi:hypothetical protein
VDSRKEAAEEGASGETAPLLTSTGGGGGDMAGVRRLRESSVMACMGWAPTRETWPPNQWDLIWAEAYMSDFTIFFFKIATLKILLQQPRGRDSSWLFLLRENVALETGLPAEAIATKVLAGCESLATLKILFIKWDLIKGQSCYSGIFLWIYLKSDKIFDI